MRNYPQEQLTINAARRILAGTKFTETMAIFREVGIFITDFDDTLSEGDTISTILDTAAECAQTTKGVPPSRIAISSVTSFSHFHRLKAYHAQDSHALRQF